MFDVRLRRVREELKLRETIGVGIARLDKAMAERRRSIIDDEQANCCCREKLPGTIKRRERWLSQPELASS